MQTIISRVSGKLSDKYQAVVPKSVRDALNVDKGDELIWRVKSDGRQIVAEVLPKCVSWTRQMKGMGEKVWKNEDVDKYINKLRDEWEK